MELTVSNISKWFDEFNARYFKSVLIKPSFRITKHKTYLGRYWYRRSFNRIDISVYYKREEKNYQCTLLHEMIHCYIDQQNIRDTSSHGVEFKRIASYINRDGWNIRRTCSLSEYNVLTTSDNIECYILHYKYNNEDYLANVAKGSVKKLNRWFKNGMYSHSVRFINWYHGYSNKFFNMPKSVTRLHGIPYNCEYMNGLEKININ